MLYLSYPYCSEYLYNRHKGESIAYMKKYEIIEEYVREKISSGEWKYKDKIEGVEELCERFAVSHITVQKAMTELAAEGLIVRVKGSGTFVNRGGSERVDLGEAIERKKVSLIIPVNEDIPDSSTLIIAKGAKNRADELGYNLMIEICNQTFSSFTSVVETTIAGGTCGVAAFVFDVPAAVRAKEAHPELPYVMIDLFDDTHPCAGVTANNADGEILAVNHLIAKGHKRIGFVGVLPQRSTERERHTGYRIAMRAAGCDEFCKKYQSTDDLPTLVEDIRAGRITAVCTINDQLAIMLIRYLQTNGISVPEQCSVVGFDDHDVVQFSPVPLTTIKQNFADIGRSAVDLLDELIAGGSYRFRKIYSPVQLIERESVFDRN